jgi:biotin carboxyl carrier protein
MKYTATIDKTVFDVEPESETRVKLNGTPKDVRLVRLSEKFYQFIYDNHVYRVEATKTDDGFALRLNGEMVNVELKDELQQMLDKMSGGAKKKVASGDLKAPMPGLVVKLEVRVGDTVKKGQGLLILEAMKMQNEIKSPVDGVVKEIRVAERQAVEKNFLLMKLE